MVLVRELLGSMRPKCRGMSLGKSGRKGENAWHPSARGGRFRGGAESALRSADYGFDDRDCRNRRGRKYRSVEDPHTETGPDHAGCGDARNVWAGDTGGNWKLYPKLPVIMFSTLTERGAAITL